MSLKLIDVLGIMDRQITFSLYRLSSYRNLYKTVVLVELNQNTENKIYLELKTCFDKSKLDDYYQTDERQFRVIHLKLTTMPMI